MGMVEKWTPHSLCLIRLQFDIYVNFQNNRLHLPTHEVTLKDVKVGVWCAISATAVTGPIFFF